MFVADDANWLCTKLAMVGSEAFGLAETKLATA